MSSTDENSCKHVTSVLVSVTQHIHGHDATWWCSICSAFFTHH